MRCFVNISRRLRAYTGIIIRPLLAFSRETDITEALFSRILGFIWVIAFASYAVQVRGLIGVHGVLPAAQYLPRVAQYFGRMAWFAAPSLFWISPGDTMLLACCLAGVVCGALAMCCIVQRLALMAAFVLYVSLVNVSQEFLSYQWDYLLLETGFLAIFLGYSPVIVWLFRWLLFRLMFLSGIAKILSGDPTWRNFDALRFHYETQPLPTPLAWYAHRLPIWFQKTSCVLVLFIELALPFLALAPRRVRRWAAPGLIGLQLMILLTGNYAYFNWLSIALCLFLFIEARAPVRPRERVAWAVAAVILFLSGALMLQTFRIPVPGPVRKVLGFAAPFGIVNTYGLFATMTTTRPEIVIEGSEDGILWKEYDFRYKPGRLDRAPPWVAPHQPRLDWQMWFAALGSYHENVWFVNLLARILQGTPEVLRLLQQNPFPERPPKFVRALVYQYRFSQDGGWWTRTPAGTYVPQISLANLADLPLFRRDR